MFRRYDPYEFEPSFYGRSEGRSVPKKIEIEVKEEDGTIVRLPDPDTGIGFISCNGERIGYYAGDQQRDDLDEFIELGKGTQVKFIRNPKAKVAWIGKWRVVAKLKPKTIAQKPAAKEAKMDANTRFRLMVKMPGEPVESVAEGFFAGDRSSLGRTSAASRDPVKKLTKGAESFWFEGSVGDRWVKCDKDPRPPFRERRRSGSRR